MNNTKKVRLVIELPDDLHAEVKARAAFRKITIRGYVLQTLIARMRQEQLYEIPEK